MAIWKRTRRAALYVFLTVLGIFFCTPVLFLLTGSVTSRYELGQYLAPLSDAAKGFVYWKWMPDYPAFSHYENVLLFTPQFYVVFWNSVKITAFILAGQLLVAVPAAWAFAIYPFPRRRQLFTVYLVLMLMPFQVTMLSSYLVLNGLHLMNTHGAVILPAVFSTFPVFLIYRSFCGIPKELLEAARVDGAGEWQIFWRMGIPLASGGILSSAVLGFLECWNLIEQPLAFLKDQSLWPLSLYLPEISLDQAGYAFVASVITLIPALFVFLLGRDYLERGIAASALKE
ncbi:sugar permease [Lachnoclostridium sp. An196]|uniref:carbohydrate ABC transporter permease n=1 Tax=Lachnoclostridium sp. An196 TaxID=1965583 RepID=UPI000B37217B|nr:carbohydrate ABC transporter permease [Lachnoclostridium sp. An196]OUP20773.1 sugar permease [Lachnoclostridium sp. An196]